VENSPVVNNKSGFLYIFMSIGERLKEERKRLKFTQPNFAELAGASKWSQIDWEKGIAYPNAEYLARIADAGADVQYIVTGVRRLDNLSALEQALLTAARAAPDLVGEALTVLLSGKKPKKFEQTFNGSVGSLVEAENISGGDFRVDMRGKK
jgi:transcriptional regulator with XRE-family HTH domain